MKLWTCFACESDSICAHREPELIAWAAALQRDNPQAFAVAIARPAAAPLIEPEQHQGEMRIH